MNRLICSLFVIAFATPQLVLAQAAPEPPLVTVTGIAEIQVKPDVVELRVGVQANSPKLETAKTEYDAKMRAAMEALKQQGVAESDIATSYLRIQPETTREDNKPKSITYSVRQELSVRLHDVTKAEAVLTALLKAGVNVVEGVSYETSEPRKHRDEARKMAVKAAREKADALAAELGAKRGKAYRIREEKDDNFYSPRNTSLNISANAVDALLFGVPGASTLAAGTIKVTAAVEVAFLIE